MPSYVSDRAFTDYIHNHLAVPLIYEPINWKQVNLDDDIAKQIDMQQGIDYVFEHNGKIKTVQERFREVSYRNYSDFTIRYRRDNNTHLDRRKSEYYKMQADYFTYGITNCYKSADLSKCTNFVKFAIIDLKKVYAKIDIGDIIIRDNKENTCKIVDDSKIECPVKKNKDRSSSFFPIEISYLVRLWGDDIIIAQKGFLENRDS